jgi:hypothetical protein
LGKLGQCLTKGGHIVIVGGPGNSQGRTYHYSFEKDVDFMAKRMRNTDVRFVNLFKRHGKVLMNGTRGV